jgi:hypothetical protein
LREKEREKEREIGSDTIPRWTLNIRKGRKGFKGTSCTPFTFFWKIVLEHQLKDPGLNFFYNLNDPPCQKVSNTSQGPLPPPFHVLTLCIYGATVAAEIMYLSDCFSLSFFIIHFLSFSALNSLCFVFIQNYFSLCFFFWSYRLYIFLSLSLSFILCLFLSLTLNLLLELQSWKHWLVWFIIKYEHAHAKDWSNAKQWCTWVENPGEGPQYEIWKLKWNEHLIGIVTKKRLWKILDSSCNLT